MEHTQPGAPLLEGEACLALEEPLEGANARAAAACDCLGATLVIVWPRGAAAAVGAEIIRR